MTSEPLNEGKAGRDGKHIKRSRVPRSPYAIASLERGDKPDPLRHIKIASQNSAKKPAFKPPATFAAIDLGTNNCRLLIAEVEGTGFKVIDAFSRIVRLGEGLAQTGKLCEKAQFRAIEALKVCAQKIENKNIKRFGFIATEACRQAENGEAFLLNVKAQTGLHLKTISRRTEARLAAVGCAPLIDLTAKSILLFDIGGGSTELVWVSAKHRPNAPPSIVINDWASLPIGVVTLAEKHGGTEVTPQVYANMQSEVEGLINRFAKRIPRGDALTGMQMLGTSGTVTTLAGLHLNLPKYERRLVDGLWLENDALNSVMTTLKQMDYQARRENSCIGEERADLVLAGCAILEAIRTIFPLPRLRVADRGLREGLLFDMIEQENRHKFSSKQKVRVL